MKMPGVWLTMPYLNAALTDFLKVPVSFEA